jgi:hypothetical protein
MEALAMPDRGAIEPDLGPEQVSRGTGVLDLGLIFLQGATSLNLASPIFAPEYSEGAVQTLAIPASKLNRCRDIHGYIYQ